MIPQTNNFNPILLSQPEKLYHSTLDKAKLIKIASIINLICIFIISFYLMSFIITSNSFIPLANISISIMIPVLGISFSILNGLSKTYYKDAHFYKEVAVQQNFLKFEDESLIKNYLKKIKCLNVLNIKKIIPALAYYKVWDAKTEYYINENKQIENVQSKNEIFKYKMIELQHEIREKNILPAKLKLAQYHHIISFPSDKRMLSDFGKIFTTTFSERKASIQKNDDYYFIFNDAIQKQRQKKGLSSVDVDKKEIQDISKLIYDN